jgi:hypothetical protein
MLPLNCTDYNPLPGIPIVYTPPRQVKKHGKSKHHLAFNVFALWINPLLIGLPHQYYDTPYAWPMARAANSIDQKPMH